MGKLVLTPGKEWIETVKARKNYQCHECEKPIFKGDYYIADHINYLCVSHYGKPWLKHYRNKICFNCWTGPVP